MKKLSLTLFLLFALTGAQAACVLASFDKSDIVLVNAALMKDYRINSVSIIKSKETQQLSLFIQFRMVLGLDKYAKLLQSTLKGSIESTSPISGTAINVVNDTNCNTLSEIYLGGQRTYYQAF